MRSPATGSDTCSRASCCASAGGPSALHCPPRQRADIDVYGLMGGFILTCVFAWIMDRRQTAGKETFPKLRDQIADFAVEYIASKSYRKNKDKEDE